MWLVKGFLFGVLLSVVFAAIYLKGFIGPTREGVAIGLSLIKTGLHMPVFGGAYGDDCNFLPLGECVASGVF